MAVFDLLNKLTARSHLVMPLEELMSLHEVLILQLLLQQLVFLLQVALLQLPHGCLSSCCIVSQRREEIEQLSAVRTRPFDSMHVCRHKVTVHYTS